MHGRRSFRGRSLNVNDRKLHDGKMMENCFTVYPENDAVIDLSSLTCSAETGVKQAETICGFRVLKKPEARSPSPSFRNALLRVQYL